MSIGTNTQFNMSLTYSDLPVIPHSQDFHVTLDPYKAKVFRYELPSPTNYPIVHWPPFSVQTLTLSCDPILTHSLISSRRGLILRRRCTSARARMSARSEHESTRAAACMTSPSMYSESHSPCYVFHSLFVFILFISRIYLHDMLKCECESINVRLNLSLNCILILTFNQTLHCRPSSYAGRD